MNFTGISEQGLRDNLEDVAGVFHLVRYHPKHCTITGACLFDGAGGMGGGDVASMMSYQIASRELITSLLTGWDAPRYIEILVESLRRANQEIIARQQHDRHLSSMASTAVCVLIDQKRCYIAWVGDSRVYLWRQGQFRPLTRDHREVETLIERGVLTPAEAHRHPLAHALNRYLGQREGFAPETRIVDLQDHDMLLMCSDGLVEALSDGAIATLLSQYASGRVCFADLPRRLAEEAMAEGGTDNITVLLGEQPALASAIPPLTEKTLTGMYPVAASEAMQHAFKEK